MSLRGHVRAVRALAAGSLVWVMVQAGQGLWLGDWRYALSEAAGGLLWLALVVVLPLRTSGVLACPSCGHSYGPRILLKMACPRCGAPVPADVRTRRGVVCALALLAALAVGIQAYTWPMALPRLPEGEVSVVFQRDAEPLIPEGEFVAIPQVETRRCVLTPGSPEAEVVAEILSDYICRRCWKTLRGDTAVSGLGEVQCCLSGTDFDLSLLGNRYAFLNGAVYQIGLAGDGDGAELTQRLWDALEGAAPQSTPNP